MSKKILIFIGSMSRGGAERVISIISNDLAERGWDVSVCMLLSNSVDYRLSDKIKIVDLSGKTSSRLKHIPNWIFGIRKLVKNEKPDVILSFVARINIIVQLACLGLKERIIVSERNDPYSDGRSKLVDMLTYWLYPKADAVVFQTKRAEGYFEKRRLKNTYIITNPISVECCAGTPVKGKIVSVGRLMPQKNHKLLIDSVVEVHKSLPYVQLFIYGEGNMREELEEYTHTLEADNYVHFMGNVLNIHEKISDAELFVLSSDYEGLSNALLEAMMMGLPCISTTCAGSDEYIESGENGILVPVKSREDMTSAIFKVLENDELRTKLKNNAINKASDYKKEKVIKMWYTLIDNGGSDI